jgi:peptide deformylase
LVWTVRNYRIVCSVQWNIIRVSVYLRIRLVFKERVFIMYSDVKKKETITCFDPLITEYHLDKIIMDEGCLTWPGLWLKVERSEGIRCVYNDVDGELVQVEMHGLESRIFQHEYDHMEGTNFTQRVSRLKLNMAKRRASKMKKKSLLSMK